MHCYEPSKGTRPPSRSFQCDHFAPPHRLDLGAEFHGQLNLAPYSFFNAFNKDVSERASEGPRVS